MVKSPAKTTSLVYKVQTFHDRDAFAELYNTYITDIYRFIAFKVPTRDDAEELTSDVFLKVWDHLTSADTSTVRGFRAFIYQTARNTIIDWYRKKSTTSEIPTELHQLQIPDDEIHPLAEQTDKKLAIEQLTTLMNQMKSEYKEVLMLKYIEELSTKEIATVLGKKQTNVRVLLHRATKTLQDLIETQ